MQPNTQEAPGYFVWQPPEKPYAVHLALDVVDRLNADVMRGFGAVPKRGAEVGGVLLGTIERGETTVVRVDDFEIVPCEYQRGPSYYLSDTEQEALGALAFQQRAVGYYRSHTRDGAMSLGPQDLDWLARFFPDPQQVALLVKPFATKVDIAGIFVREDGVFPSETALEFPFRRREMLGEEAPARRSMYERKRRSRERRAGPEPEAPFTPPEYPPAREYVPETPLYLEEFAEPPPKQRPVWLWLLLGSIFLALFTGLGYQLALTFSPALSASEGAAAFSLDLTAAGSGESVTVHWKRESPAVQAAQRGVLEIEDGDFSKQVPLNTAQLKEGSVIYQNSSATVRFRLSIALGGNLTLNETVEWRQ